MCIPFKVSRRVLLSTIVGLVTIGIYRISRKVTNYYSKEHDLGIVWNDPTLKINWGVSAEEVKISEQDKNQPNFDLLGDYF